MDSETDELEVEEVVEVDDEVSKETSFLDWASLLANQYSENDAKTSNPEPSQAGSSEAESDLGLGYPDYGSIDLTVEQPTV